MDISSTATSQDELKAKALSGPHRFWEAFDIGNEGVRFQVLHEALSAVPFASAAAEAALDELQALAHEAGYAAADIYISSYGKEETEAWNVRRELLFGTPEDCDYISEVRRSERLLSTAANTFSRWFLDAFRIENEMLEAYCAGRERRMSECEAPPPNFVY